MTTFDDLLEEEDVYKNTLTPIACKFCESRYATYIEFDMELHLFEAHGIRSNYTIRNAITEGRELSHELDDDSIQKLDYEYSKYLGLDLARTSPQVSTPTGISDVDITKSVKSWSQRIIAKKDSFTFMPIISVEEFFKDNPDKPYSALCSHPLEQSPCYPIIGSRTSGRHTLYWCEICQPKFGSGTSIHLGSIEHHCKYDDPDRHEVEILARLEDLAVKGK